MYPIFRKICNKVYWKINVFSTIQKSMSLGKFVKFKFTFFRVLFLIVTALFLAVSLLPFLSSGGWWFIAILGLIFPFLFILEILFLVFWIIKKSKLIIISVLSLLLSWRQVSVIIAFNGTSAKITNRPEGTLRVLSWNVSRWDERNKEKRGGQSYRRLMLDFIEINNPDVLCFQEFFECQDPKYYEATIPVLQKLGFLYYHFFPTTQLFNGSFQYGLAIFSRYPIIKSGSFLNNAKIHSEGLIYCDIKLGDKTVRVFDSHLESPGFGKEDFSSSGAIKPSRNLMTKFKNSYSYRNIQANSASEIIQKSPFPVIVCSDVGDIPNSYAYFKLKGKLNDAFLKKGSGLGRTYRRISPTLRIDYLFVDKKFTIKSFSIPNVVYSDHYPLISDLELHDY